MAIKMHGPTRKLVSLLGRAGRNDLAVELLIAFPGLIDNSKETDEERRLGALPYMADGTGE